MQPEESLKLRSGKQLGFSDFAWFSIENYKRMGELSLADWHECLWARYEVLHTGEAALFLGQDLERILQNPVEQFLSASRPERQPSSYSVVADAEVFGAVLDAGTGGYLSDSEVQHLENVATELSQVVAAMREGRQLECRVFDCTVRDLYRRLGNQPDFLPIEIDLSATDDTLVAVFKEWLHGVRKEFGPNVRSTDWSPASVEAWVKCRVLPYLDIRAYCLSVNGFVSQAMLGRLLFPDDYDVDLTERCRKVVIPCALRLMNSRFLGAMARQLERRNDS